MPPGAVSPLPASRSVWPSSTPAGHGDRQRRRLGLHAAPAAVGARLLDLLARAAAVRARRLHHEEALRVHDLALALAGLARSRACCPAPRRCRVHVAHAMSRETLTSLVTPHTASANVSSRSTRRSAPRGWRRPPPPRPPKKSPNRSPNAEKMSSTFEKPGRRRRRDRAGRRSRSDRTRRADRRRTGSGTRSRFLELLLGGLVVGVLVGMILLARACDTPSSDRPGSRPARPRVLRRDHASSRESRLWVMRRASICQGIVLGSDAAQPIWQRGAPDEGDAAPARRAPVRGRGAKRPGSRARWTADALQIATPGLPARALPRHPPHPRSAPAGQGRRRSLSAPRETRETCSTPRSRRA